MKAYHWRDIVAARDRAARLDKGAPAPDAPDVNVTLPPSRERPAKVAESWAGYTPTPAREPRIVSTTMTTQGRKVCMECLHYAYRYCTNRRARHPVSGEHVDAHGARKDKASCGPDGRYWDPRPMPARRAREHDDSEPMQYVPPVPVRRIDTPIIDAQVIDLMAVARVA